MSSLSELLARLLKKQKQTAADIPFLHEVIDVKKYPVSEMLKWHSGGGWAACRNIISKAYSDRLITGKAVTSKSAIMKSSYSNGWLIHCFRHNGIRDADYKHLAFYLQGIIKRQGYTLNLAEVKSQKRGPNVETVIKYYLKPSLKSRFDVDSDSSLANQLYGNITIEYKSISENPFEFKFIANAYQDHKFHPPYDFEELMDLILESR